MSMTPELAALAVHDLKNALGGLEAQLEQLERAPQAHTARRAREQCTQLRREMVAFLTLYRGEGLRAMLEDESPSGLLEALARDRQAMADGAKVQVQVVDTLSAPAPSFWYFDARLVRLALEAALHNACRYARSQVWLQASERDGFLTFSVEDDGPGLAATAGEKTAWSTGLGTELCRAVARAHEHLGRVGSVNLHSRAGGGARFELVLP